jgi:hypothetical protein
VEVTHGCVTVLASLSLREECVSLLTAAEV